MSSWKCWRAGFGLLFLVLTGCGDTPRIIFRDAVTTCNELADILVKIADEESADRYRQAKIEPIKKKWTDSIRKRADVFKDFDKDQKKTIVDAIVATLDERLESALRLDEQVERLTEIRFCLFMTELGERWNKGQMIVCLDKRMAEMFRQREATLFSTRSSGNLPVWAPLVDERMKNGKVVDDHVLLIYDRQEAPLFGPHPLFLNRSRYLQYQEYLLWLRDRNTQPAGYKPTITTPEQVVARPAYITAEQVQPKDDKGPTEKQLWDLAYGNLKRQQAYPILLDMGLREKPFVLPLVRDPLNLLDSDQTWPGLTAAMESPKDFKFSDLWSDNPFEPGAGGAGGPPVMMGGAPMGGGPMPKGPMP